MLAPNGKPFTTSSIGAAVATRAIMADLRAGGDALGGPPPFPKSDRSRFLSALDEALVRTMKADDRLASFPRDPIALRAPASNA